MGAAQYKKMRHLKVCGLLGRRSATSSSARARLVANALPEMTLHNAQAQQYSESFQSLPPLRGYARLIAAAVVAAVATAATVATDSTSRADADSKTKIYCRSEVEAHTTASTGIWLTYKSGVYDVTNFVANHPGGKDKLMLAAGKDLSELWRLLPYQQHFRSPLAFELLEEMRIGSLLPQDVVTLAPGDLEKPVLVHSRDKIYDCVVVGSGVSGLQTAKALVADHGVPAEGILVLEAQDYVGGRVRQMTDFIQGVKIDVGAEFLHGSNTLLTKFAKEQGQPISEIFCWAHGDGGPLDKPVGRGYGLYYIRDESGRRRLLRYDAKDADFVRMNEALWAIAHLDENNYSDAYSLRDYLLELQFSDEMMTMAAGGFANTLCTNSQDLSFKQCIRWCRLWHGEHGDDAEEEDGDYTFDNSYACLVDHLKQGLQIETGSAVSVIQHPESDGDILAGLVKLTTTAGTSYYARSVVVTASPHVLKSGLVEFSPPLSEDFDEALATTNMHDIVKVFLKFSRPVWPKDLHGMIMTDRTNLLPEIWFRDVGHLVPADEPAKAYAVAFTTAAYARRLQALPKEEVLRLAVEQLDEVFALLGPEHMAAEGDAVERPQDLPRASEAYLGGMFWDWTPSHHPYIGGGYCSPKANTRTEKIALLAVPHGADGRLFFAGEATNMPGATAHAALESGVRAAKLVAERLAK